MAGSERDISLIIRAKNDASKAIDSVSEALKTLTSIQTETGLSAGKTDGLIGELVGALGNLERQAKGLSALGTVATQVDKASAAVARLENQVKAASESADPLVKRYEAAAAATAALTQRASESKAALESQAAATAAAKTQQGDLAAQIRAAESAYRASYQAVTSAKAPSEALKQSYRDQLGALQALYSKQAETNATYAAQRTALTAAKTDFKVLETQVRAAASAEGVLEVQSTKATAALSGAQTGLQRAREELAQIRALGQQASTALGDVAVNQEAVGSASRATAIDIERVRSALAQQTAAAGLVVAAAAPGSAASATAAYRAQVQAVRDAQAALNDARNAATALGAQMAATATPTQALSTQFLAARANVATLEIEYQAQARTLNELKGITQGFNAYVERETTLIDQAAAAQRAAAGSAGQYKSALVDVSKAASVAGTVVAGGGRKADGTVFLGLRPYEVQNLAYQINDVISGFASGQRASQILAQQGGQIFQLFQRQIFAARKEILALLPEVGVAIAVATTLYQVFQSIADRQASVRQFSAQLAGSADGALYDPNKLAATTREITKLGVALKDARDEVKQFVQAGVSTEFLDRFARTARNVADLTGVKIPQAAKQMAQAFTGGYEAIKQLDDATNFLSASQRKQIKDLFDEGRAADARRLAYELYEADQERAAAKARGPWADAVRNLGVAWKNFIDYLGNTPIIKGAIELLDLLAKGAAAVTGALPGAGASSATAEGSSASVTGIEAQIAALEKLRAKQASIEADAQRNLEAAKRRQPQYADQIQRRFDAANKGLAGFGITTDSIDKQIAALKAQLVKAKSGDPTDPNSAANSKARQEVLDGINRQLQAIGDLTDAQKVRRAGEIAYQDEIRRTGDVVAAEAQRQLAIALEVERQRKAINFSGLADKIADAEDASGDPNAKNPRSTATGSGQFVEKTWLALFRRYFPAEAQSLGKDAILDLRRDATITKQLIELYAKENAAILQKAGVSVNEAALYLAHFLGPQGAVTVLKAAATDPDATIASLLGGSKSGRQAIAANPKILGAGSTAGSVLAFAQGKVGASDDARSLLDVAGSAARELRKREADLKQTIDDLVASLEGDARAVEQSPLDKFVAGKVQEAAKKAADLKLPFSDADKARITTAATADFGANQDAETRKKNADLEVQLNAKLKGDRQDLTKQQYVDNEAKKDGVNLLSEAGQKYADLKGKLYELTQQQNAFNNVIGLAAQAASIQAQIKDAFKEGDTDRVRELQAELASVVARMRELLPLARQIAATIGDERMVAQIDRFNRQLANTKIQLIEAKDVNQQLATGLTGVFDKGAEAVANFARGAGKLKDVFAAVRDSFLQFASDFLRQIAEMIIKQQLLALLANTPIGGFIAGLTNNLATAATATATSAATAAGQITSESAVAGASAAAATAAIPVVGPGLAIETGLAMQAAVLAAFLPDTLAGLFHTGGLVGAIGGMVRNLSPSIFAGAMRYHSGGIAGLLPGEVPTILKRNEEVLTESDPRHIFNAGKGANDNSLRAANINLKNVNVFSASDLLAHAVADQVGQKVLLNHVRNNSDAFNAALGRR